MKRAIYGLHWALLRALAGALIALPAAAQDETAEPWYEVEIILFERLDPDAMGSERWPATVARPDLSDTIELRRQPSEETPATGSKTAAPDDVEKAAAQDTATPYLILPPEQYQLKAAYQKLAASDDYLPLLHLAWRQVIPPRDAPDRILIHDELDDAVDATAEHTSPAADNATGADVETRSAADIFADAMVTETKSPQLEPPAHTLGGVLTLGVGRYLHVSGDLLLYRPLPVSLETTETAAQMLETPPLFQLPQSPVAVAEPDIEIAPTPVTPPELFRIQGDLRLRSGEVHYLDHPLAGMLILFTPYTPPEPPPPPEPEAPDVPLPRVDPNQSEALPSPQ